VAPAVIVLDEPTTGLDAASSLALGGLLVSLANEGRLLLCSLHQPRPELMRMFHEVIELTCGSAASPMVNPVIADIEALTLPSGAAQKCGENSTTGKPTLLGRTVGLPRRETDAKEAQPSKLLRLGSFKAGSLKPIRTTWWPFQLLVLWRRSLIEASRGSLNGLWSAAVALGVGLFCGLVFKDLDDGLSGVQNRFGSIFFTQMFFAFCGLEVCTLWYWDRPRAEHERSANFYSGSAYFVAKALAYLWWYCLVLPGLFVMASYSLIGYSEGSMAKPLFYYLSLCGTAAASSGICLVILSLTTSLGAGISTSAIVLTILLMYSGFLRPKDALPPALRWLVSASPFSHSFAAMIANELQGVTTHFDAKGYTPVDVSGDIWLYQFDIDPDHVSENAHMLAIIAAAVWAFAFIPVWTQLYSLGTRMQLCSKTAGTSNSEDGSHRREAEAWTSSAFDQVMEQPGHSLAWTGLSLKLSSGGIVFEDLSGRVASRRPLAVLGPSGCGKTSLLSRLAGQCPKTVLSSGSVCIDGREHTQGQLSRMVGYVCQDDALQATLTVREVLSFAAALRLPELSSKQRADSVQQVMEKLDLQKVANSRIGGERKRGVSGGERRRVAVGMELVAAQQVLVLDEPTSGLDAAGALTLCRLLADLALEGRVVVASVHQPRPELLSHFADVLVLAPGGKIAYYGTTPRLEDHVTSVCGSPAPGATTCAADRILDAVSRGDSSFADAYPGSEAEKCMSSRLDSEAQQWEDVEQPGLPVPKVPPIATQLYHLLLREVRISLRESGLAPWHYGSALFSGLLLGLSYHSLPLNLVGVISRIGLFFAVQCILGMQALQSLMAWREGHTGFVRERAAGYYSTGPFVLAKAAVDGLLLRIGPPLLLGAVLYPLAGLHDGRAIICIVGLCLASLASSTFCLALGALAPRSAVGLPVAVLMLLIFLLFGGVMLSDAPDWLASLSYFRASYHLLVRNEFMGSMFEFDPAGISKKFNPLPGEEWLRLLHFSDVSVAQDIVVLLAWSAAFVAFAWAALLVGSCRDLRVLPVRHSRAYVVT